MRLLWGKAQKDYEVQLFLAGENAAKARVLQDTVGWLEKALAHEKQRADKAVDELLAMRGLQPISPAPPMIDPSSSPLFEEDPAEVAKVHHELESKRDAQ